MKITLYKDHCYPAGFEHATYGTKTVRTVH